MLWYILGQGDDMFRNNDLKYRQFIFLFSIFISTPVFSYDQFDISICKAMPYESERNKCIADLKGDYTEFENPKNEYTAPEKQNKKIVKTHAISTAVNKNSFRQVGYFKDSAKNRIFTIEMKGNINKSQAYAFAKSKPNTIGRVTAVYFYLTGSVIPADGVTRARNIFKANDVLYDTKGLSNWNFAYMKRLNGSEEFVDCVEYENNLCRE